MDESSKYHMSPDSPWHPGRLLPAVTATGLVMMVCAYYLAADYGGVARVFYLLVLLPAVLTLVCGEVRGVSLSSLSLYLMPVAWLALSVSWATDPGGDERSVFYLVKPLPMLAGLYLAIHLALQRSGQLVELLPRAVVLAALVSAAVSLVQYLHGVMETGTWPRMSGFSLRHDVNVTAALFGTNCLFCAWGLRHWGRGWRWPVLASLMLSTVVAVLSRSKVPMLGVILAAAWLVWESRREPQLRRVLRYALPVVLLLPVAYYLYFQRIPFIDRPEGYSYRLDLWQQALAQWVQRPLFGHGVGTALPLELWRAAQPAFDSHAHNTWLETLRYGGIVGAALITLQWVVVALRSLRLAGLRSEYIPVFAWWAYGTLFLLTNGQQPLVKPHHLWFFYWIPLGLLLAGAASRLANGRDG